MFLEGLPEILILAHIRIIHSPLLRPMKAKDPVVLWSRVFLYETMESQNLFFYDLDPLGKRPSAEPRRILGPARYACSTLLYSSLWYLDPGLLILLSRGNEGSPK